MYSYPEALDAMQKIATDLLVAAGRQTTVTVMPDIATGTASVNWSVLPGGKIDSVQIRMPVLPAHHKMTAAEFDDYAGYVFHEVGHPLFTNQKVWKQATRDGNARLLNALEDVRIEKALIEARIAANGKAVLSSLVRSLDYACARDSFDPNEPKNIGFVMGFLGRAANGYDMDKTIVTKRLRKGSAVSKVLAWALPELAKCRSTQGCLTLAEKIIAALPYTETKKGDQPKGNQPKGDQPKGDQPKGDQGEKGEKGEGEKGEGEKGEGEKGDQPAKQPGKGEGEKGDKPGQGGAGEYQAVGFLSDYDIAEVDIAPKAKDAVKDEWTANGTKAVIQGIREANKNAGRTIPKVRDSLSVPHMSKLASDAAKASRQRALLARALRANDNDAYDGGLKHGRLDRRAFGRVAAGATNVFGRREVTEGYESDVVILVDGSGSMTGGNIGPAATMAMVVAQAAAQVGVNCATYVFGASGTRISDFGLYEVNAGRDKPKAASFMGLCEAAGGGTPLCPSMLAVATRQVKRAPAKRRVLFVISDGMCNQGEKALKATATYIEEVLGTECANLSIGNPLKGCFRNEVLVDPAKDIAAAGLTQLTNKLMAGAR
jgi:Mg-chelatase subunit ChlD